MSEHRVRVNNGWYTFVAPHRGDIQLYTGDTRLAFGLANERAVICMMRELDAARVVVQAARRLADHMERIPPAELESLTKGDAFVGITRAVAQHDRLTDDREPPSAWCGEVRTPAETSSRPDVQSLATDPPIDLADLERRATRDAQKLDGLHGDPSKAGGWIGHRDYARALVLLIPRLRRAEAAARASSPPLDLSALRAWRANNRPWGLPRDIVERAHNAACAAVDWVLAGCPEAKPVSDTDNPYRKSAECTHGLAFDYDAARGLPAHEVRKRWPRLFGECPNGCGYNGIAYVSMLHYVCGDW